MHNTNLTAKITVTECGGWPKIEIYWTEVLVDVEF